MAHAVRVAKYKEFDPDITKWMGDKRNYDVATEALEVQVAKNYSKLALPCAAIYPEIKKGCFAGFKVAAAPGPLKDYFEQDDVKKKFFHLVQNAVIDALAKKEVKENGDEVEASGQIVNVTAFREPPRPVWTLTVKELESYFSEMKSLLASVDGVKIKRKWPKITEGKPTLLPTQIPSLDEVCEKILPSEIFVPGKKFPLGNVQWRMKLIIAYIMLKNGKNPDSFATEVPEDYKPTGFKLKDLKEFSNNIEASAPRKIERKKKGDKIIDLGDIDIENARPDVARQTVVVDRPSIIVTNQADDDFDPNITVTASSSTLTQPVTRKGSVTRRRQKPSTKEPSVSRTEPYDALTSAKQKKATKTVYEGLIDVVTVPLPENVLIDTTEFNLDESRETGTPGGSDDDDDIPLASLSKRSNSQKRYRGIN